MAVPMGATHLLVPGLQPHIQYQFSVLAQNKLGSGPFSEIVLSIPEGKGSPSLHCTEKGWGGPGVGVGQRCRAAWSPERVQTGCGRMCGLSELGKVGERQNEGFRDCYPSSVCLSHSGLPTTPAASRLPPTEMPPPLSPPRGLVAVRTPRGVLLHWDPPELIPKRLDGYVLEGRQGPQDWEILDQAVAGTEIQLLVPGLIKVCAEREGPPGHLTVFSSSLILSSHPDLAIFTPLPYLILTS